MFISLHRHHLERLHLSDEVFNHRGSFFQWIHYKGALDPAFCYSCCKAAKQGKVAKTDRSNWMEFDHKGFYKLDN